ARSARRRPLRRRLRLDLITAAAASLLWASLVGPLLAPGVTPAPIAETAGEAAPLQIGLQTVVAHVGDAATRVADRAIRWPADAAQRLQVDASRWTRAEDGELRTQLTAPLRTGGRVLHAYGDTWRELAARTGRMWQRATTPDAEPAADAPPSAAPETSARGRPPARAPSLRA
ncbi:MAG: hypothetical protein AAF772_21695, partial [Acidobacteriota bacterium]